VFRQRIKPEPDDARGKRFTVLPAKQERNSGRAPKWGELLAMQCRIVIALVLALATAADAEENRGSAGYMLPACKSWLQVASHISRLMVPIVLSLNFIVVHTEICFHPHHTSPLSLEAFRLRSVLRGQLPH
jgi:hypothetical protein